MNDSRVVRWKEPVLFLLVGFIYINSIIFAAKPSLPILHSRERLPITVSQKDTALYVPNDTIWKIEKAKTLVEWKEGSHELRTVGPRLGVRQESLEADLDLVHLPLLMLSCRNSTDLVLMEYEIAEEQVAYHISRYIWDGSAILPGPSRLLPGHLTLKSAMLGWNDALLYSRKSDSRLFRLVEAPFADGPAENQTISLPGPLLDEYPGRLLASSYMKPTEHHKHAVLATQYLPFDNSLEFQVSLSIYTQSHLDDRWDRHLLWKLNLTGLGDNLIDADQVDYLYFLTNPLIATSPSASTFVFVFMGRFFTLYRSSDPTEPSDPGYKFSISAVQGLYGADFDVDLIQIFEQLDETLLIVVSEVSGCWLTERQSKRVHVFSDTRNIAMGLFERTRNILGSSLLLIAHFFEAWIELVLFADDGEQLVSSFDSYLADFTEQQPQKTWSILGIWSGDLAGLGESTVRQMR
ncbi:hypothetical protein HDU91_004698 [Kappamyces sp. JEL0680]|nr:hypothetical protein HDU91_004698 [Kappamyces sp. JEL0680]